MPLGFNENGTVSSYAPGVEPPGGRAVVVRQDEKDLLMDYIRKESFPPGMIGRTNYPNTPEGFAALVRTIRNDTLWRERRRVAELESEASE